jgi:hypothetical protein
MTTTHINAKELSLEDLRDNFAVMVNNAITEGRDAQVADIVEAYRIQTRAPRSLIERIRDFLAA